MVFKAIILLKTVGVMETNFFSNNQPFFVRERKFEIAQSYCKI